MMVKDLMIRSSSAEFLIFERQTHDKGVQVRFEDGDLQLTQKAMSELYNCTTDNISLHLKKYIMIMNLSEIQLPRNSRQFKKKEIEK